MNANKILVAWMMSISLCCYSSLLWAVAPDLVQAQALMNQDKNSEAYTLLEAFEFEMAGNVDFDYLLGRAALGANKPDKASLAFERVLAVNPNFAGARLDMARAYYALGDFVRAKTELETVLTLDPPPAARVQASNYLKAIQEKTKIQKTRLSAYVETTVGRDSNVNSATSQSQVFVPLFATNFTLDQSSTRTPDNYASITTGVEINHSLTDALTLFAGADYKNRGNAKADTFDNYSYDFRGGAQYTLNANTYRLTLLSDKYYLDYNHNRDLSSASLEWRHAYDANNQFTLFTQGSRIRYPDSALRPNNANQVLGGVGWLHVFDSTGRTALFGSIFDGEERDTDNREDGVKSLHGIRFGGQKAIVEDVDIFASASAQMSRYNKQSLTFLDYRRDAQYDLSVGVNWRVAKDWLVRPQFGYTRNDSNFGIYDYDRYDASLTLRYDFR